LALSWLEKPLMKSSETGICGGSGWSLSAQQHSKSLRLLHDLSG
jgi:hypothetical protein